MKELQKVKRQFKRHWKYALKLKENGKAWDREMKICRRLLNQGKALYQQELKERY